MKVTIDLRFEKILDLWHKAEKGKDKKAQYMLALLYLKSKHTNTLAHAFQLLKNPQSNTSKNESNGVTSVLGGKVQTKGAIPMNLSRISTAELVEELSKREAVQKMTAEPYQSYQITIGEYTVSDTGPVVLLRIWD